MLPPLLAEQQAVRCTVAHVLHHLFGGVADVLDVLLEPVRYAAERAQDARQTHQDDGAEDPHRDEPDRRDDEENIHL